MTAAHCLDLHTKLDGVTSGIHQLSSHYILIWGKKREVRHHVEDIGVDGRIILKRILEILWEGVDWIVLAQDEDRWHLWMR